MKGLSHVSLICVKGSRLGCQVPILPEETRRPSPKPAADSRSSLWPTSLGVFERFLLWGQDQSTLCEASRLLMLMLIVANCRHDDHGCQVFGESLRVKRGHVTRHWHSVSVISADCQLKLAFSSLLAKNRNSGSRGYGSFLHCSWEELQLHMTLNLGRRFFFFRVICTHMQNVQCFLPWNYN